MRGQVAERSLNVGHITAPITSHLLSLLAIRTTSRFCPRSIQPFIQEVRSNVISEVLTGCIWRFAGRIFKRKSTLMAKDQWWIDFFSYKVIVKWYEATQHSSLLDYFAAKMSGLIYSARFKLKGSHLLRVIKGCWVNTLYSWASVMALLDLHHLSAKFKSMFSCGRLHFFLKLLHQSVTTDACCSSFVQLFLHFNLLIDVSSPWWNKRTISKESKRKCG